MTFFKIFSAFVPPLFFRKEKGKQKERRQGKDVARHRWDHDIMPERIPLAPSRTTMTPASPTQERRRSSVGWVGGDEWDLYRPTIQELYQAQNLPLKDVMKIMEDRHGFRAT